MRVEERKLGRIFQLVFGALKKADMIAGFQSMKGYDVDVRHFEDGRELLALGNITWPEKPPAALGDVTWSQPQPYVHIHMALSGGPVKTEVVLVGHLSAGQVQGMFAGIYEFV